MSKLSCSADASFKLDIGKVVWELCRAVGSPRALAVWLLFSNGEHDQLLELKCNPLNYPDAASFADDYLVTSMLSKYKGLKTSIDTKRVATQTFIDCERKCAKVNTKFVRASYDQRYTVVGVNAEIISLSRKICSYVLGKLWSGKPGSDEEPVPLSRDIEMIFEKSGWGGGTTSSAKGKALSGYKKLQSRLEATPDLITVGAHHLVNSIPMWATHHSSGTPDAIASVTPDAIISIPGNTVTFVPKNAKTDRPIAVEPHLNAFLQKGIGKVLRSKLKYRLGIDLSSQERNQELARLGSLRGDLATVDLKSASDTIAREVVELLIPEDWCKLLDVARSKCYKLDGKWYPYHKWSSMGNGYTFELETLIFAAVSYATCATLGLPLDDISVYGDDIIVPAAAYKNLVEVLDVLGFSVNESKSYHDGPFRESCGKDWFSGVQVRPFYIKEELRSLADIYRLANSIVRYSAMRCGGLGRDARFFVAWRTCFLSVDRTKRFSIPDGIGDGGFIRCLDEALACPHVRTLNQSPTRRLLKSRRDGWCYRFEIKSWDFRPRWQRKRAATVTVASALWQCVDSDPVHATVTLTDGLRIVVDDPLDKSIHTLRDVGRWERRVHLLSEWTFLGPWC